MTRILRGLVATACLTAGALLPTQAATPRTISINFGSGSGSVSGEYGIVPSSSWNNFSDAKQTTAVDVTVSDGTSGVTAKWWSKNTWSYTTGVTDNALKGYLDDGACGDGATTDGAHIAILGIPFAYYDVIVYYATDTAGSAFNPASFKKWTVQTIAGDESDSYDGTMRLARNDASLKFGKSQNATAVIGTNVSYLKRCFSFADLDIKAGKNANSARGGIAAIQIVECDPHLSEMYYNRLAGSSLTIPADTYGAIAVGTPIKATQYTANNSLTLTGSTAEIGGNARYIIGQSTNTRTHSLGGWFRCDGLDEEKMLYAALAYTGDHAGYKVAVDANGAIEVGKCSRYAWYGTPLKSANGVIEANRWYYITVAVTSTKPDDANATVRVFVNGTAISFPTGTFATNLDGYKMCNELTIGAGVSAAGLYADFSAISDAGLVQSLATNSKYVAYKGNDYVATIKSASAKFSGLTWDPEHTGPFSGTESLTLNVEDVSSSQLTIDETLAAAELTVSSSADFAIVKDDDVTVTIPSFDFTSATGRLTLGIPMTGVTSTYAPTPNVYFDYAYSGLPPVERGTLEYSNAALTWNGNIAGDWTLKVAAGDTVSIDSTAAVRPSFNVDISGGTLTFDPDGSLATAWCGNNGATTYNQTGGEVYFNVNGQGQSGSGNGVILGYTGTAAAPLVLNISGGLFAVENSSINFWNAATINLSGGTVRTKGVFAGATSGEHVVDIASGAVFELGSLGWRSGSASVTLGGTLRAYENTMMEDAITYADGAKLVATTGKSLYVKGAVTGDGTITCGDATDNGEVVFVDSQPPAGIAGTYYYGYVVTINDRGKYKIPDGRTWEEMRLLNANGSSVAITSHDANYVYFTWEIVDGACWWDYEFNGDLTSSGTDKTSMTEEGTKPYYDEDNTALWVGHATPWRNAAYPAEFTAVMYGTMVSNATHVMMGFGSTTAKGSGAANPYAISLACGDPSKNEVKLLLSTGFDAQELVTMAVPNAYTSDHLYAFVCETVSLSGTDKTRITIYLDGEVLQTYVCEGVVVLGGGFQIGSVHGGKPTGYLKATVDDEGAFLDFLRLYKEVVSAEAMQEYAKRYPYVSPNGSYQRDVSVAGNWDSAGAWKKEGTSTVTNVPAAGATVKISADDDSTLAVNLSEDAVYEAVQISGTGTLVITNAAGCSGKVCSSGRVTASTDAVFGYDAFSMAGAPLTVKDDKTVTFDMRSIDLNNIWSDTTYDLSGLVTTGKNARVICVYGEVPPGRTVSYGIDSADQHFKFWVKASGTLEADLSGDTAFADLVWRIGTETVHPDWTKTVTGTIHVLADNPTLTFATLDSSSSKLIFDGGKAVTLAGGSVTGMSYDFTELGENKVTFKYNPEPANVTAQYVRYDTDMGTYTYDAVLRTAGGRYEFKKIRIDGNNYDYHDRTVIVQEGDYLLLHDGTNLGSGLSLDVRGGEVHIGNLEGRAAIAYGKNGTRFNQSGGTVTVHANGNGQTGSGSGFVLSHSANGGGCHEFNVTGGLFTVPDSSICFNERTNTINIAGTGIVRAKGAFSAKGTSTGVVNVESGGAFEIGSLGMKAGACALNLNGGTLRGYETGAEVLNSITLVGDSKLASSDGANLTVSGGVTGTGAITVEKGTVKLGEDDGFGIVPVTVKSGATLDLNDFCPSNPITISGSGVGDAGALVNTGSGVPWKSSVALAADATVGGTGPITNLQGSAVNLGGNTLTIAGQGGFAYVLGQSVTGGGKILVESGKLALCDQAVVEFGSADLSIGDSGTLDLSSGTSISCCNFSSRPKGKVVGTSATLIVSGALDASTSLSVPRLDIGTDATLLSVGLVVTESLTLGEILNVSVESVTNGLQIATVPKGTDIDRTSVRVNGSDDYQLYLSKSTQLRIKMKGAISANVGLTVAPDAHGVNFESVTVSGNIEIDGTPKTGATNVTITARAGDGTVITHKYAYTDGGSGSFSYEFDGLTAGESYVFSAEVEVVGSTVMTTGSNLDVVAARGIDGWIYEDAKTIAGEKEGTGIWYGTNGVARASDGVISLYAEDWTRAAEFQPTNMTLEVDYSSVKDLHFLAAFDCPGFYAYESYPVVADGVSAAFTLVADADDNCCFAVVSNGVWSIVPRTVFVPAFETQYDVLVRLDGENRCITYSVISDGNVVRLATCPVADSKDVSLDLAGLGSVKLIEGIGQDSNLARVGDEEFKNFDDAIDAAGGTNSIAPLWWSSYEVAGDGGAFRIWDPNDYLRIVWKKWHHWRNDDGTYRYIAGNNWIEYADASGVVTNSNGGEWLVTNEVGLAWIAEQATNRWIHETVSVGEDLDLSSKNWTPIAQFSGRFDGRGHTIAGLNNAHVIYTNLLGSAGYYFGGPSNDWGYTAYGLFASATNASFANVAFEDVAISNVADSTAALLGVHAGGDLAVSNVTVASGRVEGEGRAVAGILTVGGDTNGEIVVMCNTNRAVIAASVANDADGGNVAQILAGTTWGTFFDRTVVATNNVGEGDFDVRVASDDGTYAYTADWYDSEFNWFDLPVCNFAAAVVRFTEEDGFRRFVEANDPSSVPIDPVYRTARMLAGKFANTADNMAGLWMDRITAMPSGGHLLLTGELLTNNTWQTVSVDRSVSFDLHGYTIYTVYDTNTFCVTRDSQLSISNGTIIVPEGVAAFNCVGDSSVVSNDTNIVSVPGDFYDRTVDINGDTSASMGEFLSMLNFLPSGTMIEMNGSGLVVDPETNALSYDGKRVATLAGFRSIAPASASGDSMTYVLELNGNAVPEFDLDLSSAASADGSVSITLAGTRAGLYYAVQRKASLVEKDWSNASEWVYVETDGTPVSFKLPAEDASGFFRVKVTDVNPM